MSDKKKKQADKSKKTDNKSKDADKAKRKPNLKLLAEIKKKQEDEQHDKDEIERKEREEDDKLKLFQLKQEEEEKRKREKREREKLKKKEKKEKEKQEGTYMSEKEKRKIKEMRSKFNIDVLDIGDKPKPVYENKKKNKNPKSKIVEMKDTIENIENEDEYNDETISEKIDTETESELGDWEDMLNEVEEIKVEEPKEEKAEKKVTEAQIFSDDPIEDAGIKINIRKAECESKRSVDVLRAPIVCVLGHVDTGKTKILDKLRNTDVQGGETGGITQQIGATNVPIENIPRVKEKIPDLRLPGLLIIDTPGHESFSNMRTRGSNLCDMAVLVVDIMHGVEAQTKESIKLLKKRKVPYVIALNKIDRLVEWKTQPEKDIKYVLDSQNIHTKNQFSDRFNVAIQHFAEVNINIRMYWEEDDQDDYVSVVPTSAHSGDGMHDLIAYLCYHTQNKLTKKISFSEELNASVMEVKETPGHGTTLDVILVNGTLRANDTIVLGGQEGPIVTKIRYMLRPAPMAELRVKGEYTQQLECRAAQGVKVIAKDIDKAMPGLPVYCATNEDEVAYYKLELDQVIKQAIASIRLSDVGVYVQTSTIGSLEALLEFLKQQNVPYSGINIGTVHKRDVTRAAIMREKDPKWAVILAFNVRVEAEAEQLAREAGVKIFRQEIIYRLHDDMTQYLEQLEREVKERIKDRIVFPVKLRILPECIFQKRNPILIGVQIERGTLRIGSPLFARTTPPMVGAPSVVEIGKAMSLEQNKHPVSEARAGDQICVRIDSIPGDPPRMLGRHFLETDFLYSKISRDTIDLLKQHYRNEMKTDDWKLIQEIKPFLGIM